MSAIHVAIVASMLLSLNSSMMSESRFSTASYKNTWKSRWLLDDLDPYIQPVFASKSGRLAVSVRCCSLLFVFFVFLFGWLVVCLVCLFVCFFVCLLVGWLVCLFVCLLVGWFVCLFVCLFVCCFALLCFALLCFALLCFALLCFASLIVCLFWLAALACACCLRSRSSCPYQTPIPQSKFQDSWAVCRGRVAGL